MRQAQPLKNVYHRLAAQAWRLWYGRPDRSLTLYGVTGTNGKTTTCYLLDSILAHETGRPRVGMMTTVAVRVGEKTLLNTTKLTTLPSRSVYRALREMQQAGVRQVVLELSSHALDQARLAGITLAGAIILNLEREHLDYHGTMEEYTAAKMKIITYMKRGGAIVLKGDDPWINRWLQQFPSASWRTNDQFSIISFTSERARVVATPLPGDWNKENVLAASLLARAAGVSEGAIAAGIAAVQQVPGRMEWIEIPNSARVVIDYAVTPEALGRLYTYVRGQTRGKIFAVLGAAGLRDRGKRPAMARAMAELADELILTREDPWTEDEEQIFADLEKGLRDSNKPWKRIVDRREAIRWCLKQAGPDDVVVLTGKGAEEGMGVGKKIVPWNDRKVIEELFDELGRK